LERERQKDNNSMFEQVLAAASDAIRLRRVLAGCAGFGFDDAANPDHAVIFAAMKACYRSIQCWDGRGSFSYRIQ